MKLEVMRPGQKTAIETILERHRDGCDATSVVLPTRYGKSDVIRLSAYKTKSLGLTGGSVVLSPGLVLRNQIASADKVSAMAIRYGLKLSDASKVSISDPHIIDPFSNGEYLLSMTMEAATRAIELMAHLAGHVHRMIVFIDECHETSNSKPRGELVARLRECGSHVVLMTATPIRADGEHIPGFDADLIDQKSSIYRNVVDAGDGVNNRVDLYTGTKTLYRLRANCETTFCNAWNENPSPLCHLSRETFDAEFESGGKLSEMSEGQCRKHISIACRDLRTMRLGVRLMLDDMRLRKKVREELASIIFTGNDRAADKMDNAHAKDVRDLIKEEESSFGLSLDVKIATMKSDADIKAAKIIEDFCEKGRGDVLIVKQMGGAGLDAPRAKTLLDLSNVRTVASTIQRMMRVATPYCGIMTATVITPQDALSDAIWKKAVVDEGGAIGSWRGDYELEKSYLVPKKDKSEDDIDFLDSVCFAGFDDNLGNIGNASQFADVNKWLDAFPLMHGVYTKAQIADALQRLSWCREQKECSDSVSVEGSQLYSRINELSKRLANRRHQYSEAKIEWIQERKHWINYAKKSVGIDLDVELKQISSRKTLLQMIAVLESELNGHES